MSLQPNGELIPTGGGDNIPLCRQVMTLGRRDSCDVPLQFPNVSGLHCELSFVDGFWYIRDLQSTNGTKVNNVLLEPHRRKLLRTGDEIKLAKRIYTIHYTAPVGRSALEELVDEEDVMSRSLLEKAGLEKPLKRKPQGPLRHDLNQFLRGDE